MPFHVRNLCIRISLAPGEMFPANRFPTSGLAADLYCEECMASQARDQEALGTMDHVLGFTEDFDSIHFVASFGSLCQGCRYKELDDGADARIDMTSTLRQRKEHVGAIVWPTAVLIARQLQCRRVNIDPQNQGCFHGSVYDPVLTEGMDITELETGN